MTKNKKGPAPWATAADPTKKRLEDGIIQTIVYMRIISETMARLRKSKEMTSNLEIHLQSVFRASDKILKDFFKVSAKTIVKTGEKLSPDFINEKSGELGRALTKKIVMPGDKGFDFQAVLQEKSRKI